MNISIYGASNEIMRSGWPSHIRDLVHSNTSIGGSSSTAAIFSILKEGLKDKYAKFSILNYEINENSVRTNGLMSYQRMEENWEWIYNDLRSKGTQPILLITPRGVGSSLKETATQSEQIEIAARNKVPYLNLTKFFYDVCPRTPSHLMLDHVHMHDEAARAVSRYIRRIITKLDDSDYMELAPPVGPQFTLVDALGLGGNLPIVERKTSILGGFHVVLSTGSSLSFKTQEDSDVVAVVANRLASGGYLDIDGTVKRLCFVSDADQAKGYMCVVVDLNAPKSADGQHYIATKVDGEAQFTHMSKAVLDNLEPNIELEAVLLRSRAPSILTRSVLAPLLASYDLSQLVSPDILIEELRAISDVQ